MYEDQNKNGQGGSEQNPQNGTYGQYEYSFRSDSAGRPYTTGSSGGQQTPPKNGGFAKTFLTIVLCVVLSFGAGLGGVCVGYRYLKSEAGDNGSNVNDPPSQDSLLSNDPEGLLSRTDAEYSPYGSAGEDAYAISEVVRMVQDAVVVIQATVTTANSWGVATEGTSSGSGVIISTEGYILTCHHVVDGAKSVTVQLNSGSTYQAMLVGSDEKSDLAVLKIQPTDSEPLTAAKHGKSGYLVVGERVVAIGNPLGTLGGTVTDGIISATERQIQTETGTVMTLLQTNAAINSGNSGGGLFNLKGELVGIVNAKYAASGVEGLAFAIPIDSAYEVELDLIEFGYVRGIIDHGLTFLEINDSNFQYYQYKYRITEKGLYVVSSKLNDSLKNRDRIVSVNGKSVSTEADFENALEGCQVGDVLTIAYARYSGSSSTTYQTEITVQEYVPDSINFS